MMNCVIVRNVGEDYLEGLEQQAGLKPVSVEFESTDHSTLISLPLNSGTSTGSTGHIRIL